MNLCDAHQIQNLLQRHGFHFSKSMGQNFLIQPWVPRDIAAASGAGAGVGVLEVGPGIGPLTRELSTLADKVVSVELDRALLPILEETLADCPNTKVISGDILKTVIARLAEEEFAGLTPIVCANLPYNITTPVITALLECGQFRSITVMIQREAARRICALPGDEEYNFFSLFCRFHANLEPLFDVPPSCFLPAPKVTSTVLRITPRPVPEEVEDPAFFLRVTKAAFAQRRKTLVNALSTVAGGTLNKQELGQCLTDCGLDAGVRGERLSIEEFARVAREVKRRMQL